MEVRILAVRTARGQFGIAALYNQPGQSLTIGGVMSDVEGRIVKLA